MSPSVVLAPIELKCCGKCPGNTIFCNKRTGKDTVLVVNAHHKGRPDEHCCLKLPERDRKGKKTGRYIYSCGQMALFRNRTVMPFGNGWSLVPLPTRILYAAARRNGHLASLRNGLQQ